jgi:hypothetical protein
MRTNKSDFSLPKEQNQMSQQKESAALCGVQPNVAVYGIAGTFD